MTQPFRHLYQVPKSMANITKGDERQRKRSCRAGRYRDTVEPWDFTVSSSLGGGSCANLSRRKCVSAAEDGLQKANELRPIVSS